jgi:hypothetical protein
MKTIKPSILKALTLHVARFSKAAEKLSKEYRIVAELDPAPRSHRSIGWSYCITNFVGCVLKLCSRNKDMRQGLIIALIKRAHGCDRVPMWRSGIAPTPLFSFFRIFHLIETSGWFTRTNGPARLNQLLLRGLVDLERNLPHWYGDHHPISKWGMYVEHQSVVQPMMLHMRLQCSGGYCHSQ